LREIAYFWMQVFVLPVVVFLRFLIITPLSFLYPPLRRWALERYSFFVINLKYRHEVPRGSPLFWWAVLEFCCFLRAAGLIGFALAGSVPPERIPLIYSIAVLTLGLNYVRNMVAHHYRSNGEPMGHVDQLFDSVNLRGMPIVTELFFPLNLRYHALHHLFPSLPYHNLATAHRRLMAELSSDSLYRETVYPGFWSVMRDVVRNAGRVSQLRRAGRPSVADEWYARRERLLDDRYGPGRGEQAVHWRRRYDDPQVPDGVVHDAPEAYPQARVVG
jgi:fatty acid desaturase